MCPRGGLSLGPFSFLIYVNDVGRDLEFSEIRFFADDALYAPVTSHSDVYCVQKDFDVLEK